jgi:hypothetical protein
MTFHFRALFPSDSFIVIGFIALTIFISFLLLLVVFFHNFNEASL